MSAMTAYFILYPAASNARFQTHGTPHSSPSPGGEGGLSAYATGIRILHLMNNLKPTERPGRVAPVQLLVGDKPADLRILDRFPKLFQFLARPFRDQFHTAISQIPDRSRDLEPLRDGLDRITEPDALH